ncbi:MAG: DUF3341 domain-containing protein [Verrucomicrobiota bacterium]|nr:DUF3341 domain-containing protein [Verrucomicrobiota bacterium]
MSKSYGLIALFDTPHAIMHAAEVVRDAGYTHWDTLTPFPVHGLDKAMGLKRSKVPLFTFIGGVTGFIFGMSLAWYTGELAYPLVVGGKPLFSPIFPFPVAYEMTILLASFGTLAGMFITNRLPQHHHPVMDYSQFVRVTDDKFALVIESDDPKFESTQTRTFLEALGGHSIEQVNE